MITRCPVCQSKLDIIRLQCPSCKTSIEGRFRGCSFCDLSNEDRVFIEHFIVSRGSIKEVEKKLGISYPTVRGRLDSIIQRLGLHAERPETDNISNNRLTVLEDLEKGRITRSEALDKLEGLKDKDGEIHG